MMMSSSRAAKLGFAPQKELVYNKLLPYVDQLDHDSNLQLAEIKTNLGRAILLKDIVPGCEYWVRRLSNYLCLFSRKFSQEDHICLIKLLYELVTSPDLEFTLVQDFAQVLITLLKKKELLSPEILTLPWRPLHNLYETITYSPYEAHGLILFPGYLQNTVKSLIRMCQIYFPLSATQEMLDEWRPLLCPFDMSFVKGIAYFELFLPTVFAPENKDKGYGLWFDEFMELWTMSHNSPSWESNLLWLFSRLADDNIGYIDWEPYIPVLFSKILQSFNLPVGTNHIPKAGNAIEIKAAVNFITALLGSKSKCQVYLNRLFKTLESYYHPSNSGKWNLKLNRFLSKLPVTVVKRVYRERYKKLTWERPVPKSHCLSDADITEFVESLKPCILLAMFSKTGSLHSATAMQDLAILRPEIIIPSLLERLYPALETLTEPHRLTASMQCVVSVSRSMLQSKRFYPDGPAHVIPLLMCSLPGIDPNDFRKCMVTFQFIFAFATLVPLVDCSAAVGYHKDLTEQEQELCLATRQFEDFVLQFMDKCFCLIENSTLEFTTKLDRETEKMNSEEGMLEVVMTSTFTVLLMQCSSEIYKAALRKLQTFITGRILETKVSGRFAANMCRAATKANPELALKTLLPHICKMILALTFSEDIQKEENLDNELLFNMLLLSEIIRCDGSQLLQFREQIVEVLHRTLHLTNKPGYLLAGAVLRHMLKAFTLTLPLEFRSIPGSFDRSPEEYVAINDWGVSGDIDNLNVKWHVPSSEELACAQELLKAFLVPELEKLSNVANKTITLTREEIQKSLSIILDVMLGAGSLLPLVKDTPIELVTSCVPLRYSTEFVSWQNSLVLPGNKCVRSQIGAVIRKLLDFLMNNVEDDTKSLFQIIQIYRKLIFYVGINKDDLEARWKSFHYAKKAMENKLLGKKHHIRSLLIDRTQMQHEMFVLENVQYIYTDFHHAIMEDLLNLSTSHYSEVRSKAQSVLSHAFRSFPYSYKLFVPKLIELLQDNPSITHEQFKGALYVIHSNKTCNFLTQPDWATLCELWPAVITAQHSEKPSIIKLVDDISDQIQKNLETISIKLTLSNECSEVAIKLWETGDPVCASSKPTVEEITTALAKLEETNIDNQRLYNRLVHSIVELIETTNLRWRHYRMGMIFLLLLLRHDVVFPAEGVRVFVHNLIHDTLSIRKIAITAVAAILKQQKRPHKKVRIDPFAVDFDATYDKSREMFASYANGKIKPGNRPDNEWMLLHYSTVPTTQEAWEKRIFVHKTHFGFYVWPNQMEVYAPYSEQPQLERTAEDLSQEEMALYEFFSQPNNIEKWLSFLTLEERKGKDRFDAKRFVLFKGLFRNFGTLFLHIFQPHFERLVTDSRECYQRCAAEIIAGLIRGSKHWPYEMMERMQSVLDPILKIAMTKLSVETVSDWGTCVATSSENGDPSRLFWLLNLLMQDPMRSEEGSFAEASRLYVLQGGVAQQEWRVAEMLHQLLEYLKPYLTHSYQNVRIRLGSVLTNIFMMDIDLPTGQRTSCPRRSDFVATVLPQLQILEMELKQGSQSQQSLDKMDVDSSDEIATESLSDKLTLAPADKVSTLNVNKVENHVLNNSIIENSERKEAISLLKTVCKWIIGNVTRSSYSVPPEFFKFLPLLCLLESNDNDEELKQDCTLALSCMGQAFLTTSNIQLAIDSVLEVMTCNSWKARASCLSYLQVMVFTSMFSVIQNPTWIEKIRSIVLTLLEDERVEVREMAASALGGFFHCEFLPFTDELMEMFKTKCSKKLRQSRNRSEPVSSEAVLQHHVGILGLCAYINAHPYEVPEKVPDILMILSDHLNDPQPIPVTIKKTLSNFRRTHHDSWRDHKLKFSDDQLAVLTDLLVSPSYYA